MASYLRELTKKMASAKKLDWLNSRDSVIYKTDKDLDSGKITLEEAGGILEGEFHDDVAKGKISKYDIRNLIKEIGYRLK